MPRFARALRTIAVAALPLVGVGSILACHDREGGAPPLDLREAFATRLADTVGIGGVVGGPGHRLVVWTPGRERILLFERGQPRSLTLPSLRETVGAAFVSDQTLEVFDGPSGTVLTLDWQEGQERARRAAGGLQGAVMAVRAATGWYVVVPDSTLTLHSLFYLDGDPAPRRLKEFRRPTPQALPDVRLSVVNRDVLVTQANAPYAALRITPDGKTTRIAGGFERLGRDSTRVRAPDALWVSLPMLRVGRRYLQTLVNLRGDDRLLLSFAPDASATRHRVVDAPVTFFADIPGTHTLLALRQIGQPEIVEYTWRD